MATISVRHTCFCTTAMHVKTPSNANNNHFTIYAVVVFLFSTSYTATLSFPASWIRDEHKWDVLNRQQMPVHAQPGSQPGRHSVEPLFRNCVAIYITNQYDRTHRKLPCYCQEFDIVLHGLSEVYWQGILMTLHQRMPVNALVVFCQMSSQCVGLWLSVEMIVSAPYDVPLCPSVLSFMLVLDRQTKHPLGPHVVDMHAQTPITTRTNTVWFNKK